MIVHEDPPTERRARNLWDQLVHEMGEGIPFSASYKSMTEFKPPLDFEQVGATDIVIVSVHDLLHFILDAGGWLAGWLTSHSPLPRALIILYDGKEDALVLGMLEKVARTSGVTLFRRCCDVC